jgi:uncharacterized protein (DUF983 family)
MLARAAIRRCPVCGQGKLFHRWFTMLERCPRCDLRFERIEGHWTGALGVNTIVSFGLLAITVVIGLILSAPEFEVLPLFIVAALEAIFMPLFFFPFSKTIWTAIDLWMRPLVPGEAVVKPR